MRHEIELGFDTQSVPPLAAERWDVAPDSLEKVRFGENFVYRFRDPGGALRFLRIAHETHRDARAIQSELDYVNYLIANGVEAAAPVRSRDGNLIETIQTSIGLMYVVVFKGLRGEHSRWGTDAENRRLLFARGKSLGLLHRVSQSFQPLGNRRFHWYEDDLFTNPPKLLPETEVVARREYERLIQWMLKRPMNRQNYGMVHGDFGTGNLLHRIDADGNMRVAVFDFDDCCLHWNLYDIAVAMRAGHKLEFKYRKAYLEVFIKGYETEKSMNGEGPEVVEELYRLAVLYRYVSLRRKIDFNNVQPWQSEALIERLKWVASPIRWC